MLRNENKHETVGVIGAGLSGLAFIASLYASAHLDDSEDSKSFDIHFVEKRKFDFNRRQKLVVNNDLQYTEYKGQRWDEFIKSIFNPENQFALDENQNLIDQFNDDEIIEGEELDDSLKFLRKILRQERYANETGERMNFSIKELQMALFNYIVMAESNFPHIKVHWYEEASITMNLNAQQLTIHRADQSDTEVKFDTLVVCDGAKRETAELINQSIREENLNLPPFEYEPFSYQPPRFNCAVRLQIKPLSEILQGQYHSYKELLERSNSPFDFKNFAQLGWHKPGLPVFVFDDNQFKREGDNWRPRMFIASEIPESIYNIQDEEQKREAIIEWTKNIAAYKYGLPPECFELEPKGEVKLNATTFTTIMDHINDPVRQLPQGGNIVMIGDATMTPYYQAGLSSTVAMNQAMITAITLSDEEKNTPDRFMLTRNRYLADVKEMDHILEENSRNFPKITKHLSFFQQTTNSPANESKIESNNNDYSPG